MPQRSPSSLQPLPSPQVESTSTSLLHPTPLESLKAASLSISDQSLSPCTRWLRVEHWGFFYHAPTFASSRPVSLDCAYPISLLDFCAPLRIGQKSYLRLTRRDQSESSFPSLASLEAVLVICTRRESDCGRTSSTPTIQLLAPSAVRYTSHLLIILRAKFPRT